MTTQEYIKQHRNDDVYRLALAKTPEGVDLQYALQQISAYQILTKKVPSWAESNELIFPRQLSLEQSSSELTARYKAELIRDFMGNQPFTHIDLTGGMGIDCYFIAQHTSHSHYVELNPELCQIARHNFAHLNPNISVHNTTAEEFLNQSTEYRLQSTDYRVQMTDYRVQSTEHRLQITDYRLETTDNSSLLIPHSSFLIYIDPARRGDHGQKLVSIADCQPNVIELLPQMFELTDKVVVKLSPMLDITRAINELPHIEKLYVISVNNECKELLLFINKKYNAETQIHAINLKSTINNQQSTDNPTPFSGFISHESSLSLSYAHEVGKYLYEPYAAHLKSGLYKTIAQQYNCEKLHQHSHLYTSTELNNDFPGRKFEVKELVPFDKKSAKTLFKSLKQANLTTRNFPLTVSELRTQYKIKDGGETYIFATTLHNDSKVLIVCQKA
ncbi:MAG: SAM-dependent methyltransferase [Paludibacteraceae bacterium]|nr:SAM-dependent methyltransferase [Paludibacteraceae bacterium]